MWISIFELETIGWVLTRIEEDEANEADKGKLGTKEGLGEDEEGSEDNGELETQESDNVEWRISKGKQLGNVDK